MEVVSTLNLVSSETEKTTAACNFQHDYTMRGKYEAIHESYFMIAEMWKRTLRNTYTQNIKIKTTSEKKKVDNKVFFAKQ